MKYVSDKDEPQEVKEGKDVIFTYDVVYEVRLAELFSWRINTGMRKTQAGTR